MQMDHRRKDHRFTLSTAVTCLVNVLREQIFLYFVQLPVLNRLSNFRLSLTNTEIYKVSLCS